jgi:phosphoribosylamine--glycine ligase
MDVLVIGSGARENALADALAHEAKNVFVAPGNPGTAEIVTNVPIAATDIPALIRFAKENSIDLIVVGPELPLSMGIVNAAQAEGLNAFGPTQEASLLETSKVYSNGFVEKYGIPAPESYTFSDIDEARAFLLSQDPKKYVIKADGLAGGKGVVLPETYEEIEATLEEFMLNKKLGSAGETILVQERLYGPEVSILAFCDGNIAVMMVPAEDHKSLLVGGKGPNTGGMGARTVKLEEELLQQIQAEFLDRTLAGMREEGHPFKGVLFLGLILTKDGPKLLEYNVRFGDPETQAILALRNFNLLETMMHCVNETLENANIEFKKERVAASVVLASAGYPDNPRKGDIIDGLDDVPGDVKILHAGTEQIGDDIYTAGGRVLNIVAEGVDYKEVNAKVEAAIDRIHFDGMQYRKDIVEN